MFDKDGRNRFGKLPCPKDTTTRSKSNEEKEEKPRNLRRKPRPAGKNRIGWQKGRGNPENIHHGRRDRRKGGTKRSYEKKGGLDFEEGKNVAER